jgi:sugar phosphate isomerase/epimerase
VDRNPTLDPPVVLGKMDALARFAAARGLGITLDTCHAMRTGARGPDLLQSYHLVRPHLVNVHLSDWRDIGSGERRLLQRSLTANHLLPGHGQAPLQNLLQRLAADGYDGPVTLEVNPWLLRPWSPAACRRALMHAVAYIRQAEDTALRPS